MWTTCTARNQALHVRQALWRPGQCCFLRVMATAMKEACLVTTTPWSASYAGQHAMLLNTRLCHLPPAYYVDLHWKPAVGLLLY